MTSAIALLDRGWGRPSQYVEASLDTREVRELSTPEIYALLESRGLLDGIDGQIT